MRNLKTYLRFKSILTQHNRMLCRIFILLFLNTVFLIFSSPSYGQITQTYNTPGSYTFTVPPDVNEIIAECWGTGGKGGVNNSTTGGLRGTVTNTICPASSDGTEMQIYIDGILVVPQTHTSTTSFGVSTNTAKIGAYVFDSSTTNYFNSETLKAGFWNKTLSQAEITSLAPEFYKYTGSETGIFAGYNFYEGPGTSVWAEGTRNTTACASAAVSVYSAEALLSGSAAICSGSSTTLSVDFTGTAPYSITYSDGTTPVTINGITEDPYSLVVSPASSTTYILTDFSDANYTGTVSGSALVVVDGGIPLIPGNDTTICYGDTSALKIEQEDSSVLLNGTNSGISIANHVSINTSNVQKRTVALWFNANDINARQVLFEEGGGANGFSIFIENGNIYVHAWETNTSWGEVKTAVNANTWHHIAFVFDSGASDGEYFKGYLNGAYFGGNSDPAANDGMKDHIGDVNIGRSGSNLRYPDNLSDNSPNYFNGYVDEFKLWNRSLTGEELLTERWNVNDGTLSGANLIIYYNFNNDSGNTATDETGVHDGSILGGLTYETDTPLIPTVSWSPGGMTGFVESASPDTSTIYTYTLTYPFGCQTSGTITVNVNPLPAASITANDPVCEGDDAQFEITGTDGALVTYSLNGGTNTTTTLVGGTATISVPGPLTDQILTLVLVTDGICSQALTENATVVVNPYPPTGDIIPD